MRNSNKLSQMGDQKSTVCLLLIFVASLTNAQTNSIDNKLYGQPTMETTTTSMVEDSSVMGFNFMEVVRTCNASFPTPIEFIQRFNETAELPNTADKTSMCFMYCYMENSGLMRNWQLNRTLIMQTMWPATGDSIPVCQKEGSQETCACRRTYAIAKCLMLRALVDARNKSIV